MTPFSSALGDAAVSYDGYELVAETSRMWRRWQRHPSGVATVALQRRHGKPWPCRRKEEPDWHLRGVTDRTNGECIDAGCARKHDSPIQQEHLEVWFTFRHLDPGIDITWMLKLWRGAPGTWTRLRVKPIIPFDAQQDKCRLPSYLGNAWGEMLPLRLCDTMVLARGLYCDSQHRHFDHTPMLRSEAVALPAAGYHTSVEWASLITLSRADEGITIVKESHKCVNSDGVDTGAFVLDDGGLRVTGLGISPYHYGGTAWWRKPEIWTWPTWTVLHAADDTHAQLAWKRMDRLRFPFRPQRDGMVMSNTWGSGGAANPVPGDEGSPAAATEERLLREIRSAGDLGVDILQIDDGWQYAPWQRSYESSLPWRPDPERLPSGWSAVVDTACEAGVNLGLWVPYSIAREHPEKILDNQRAGGFRRFKFDFMCLSTPDDIDVFRQTMTAFMEQAAPDTGINFDITESTPRVGYFFAREFGNLFFANRENGPGPMWKGSHIAYTPRLALREYWHLAHVMNLNQLQLTVQDKDHIPPGESNARRYSHSYVLAMALMGVPLFFMETHTISQQARTEWKGLLDLYRQHREAIWHGYVFPVGDEPNDRSVTGFQSHDPDTGSGYLTVFREVDCADSRVLLPVHFLTGTVTVEDLITGEVSIPTLGSSGRLPLDLPRAGAFRFIRYEPVPPQSIGDGPAAYVGTPTGATE